MYGYYSRGRVSALIDATLIDTALTDAALIDDATIAAVATPPGRGAIALIRISGKNAHAVAQRVVKPWPAGARVAQLCSVVNGAGRAIDHAVVTIYSAPHSFTGEDMVEISTHGGLVVPSAVLAELIRSAGGDSGLNFREALPGEFTRRAVLNGKIDLVQAEAIGDLIDALSSAQHSAALQQLDGGLSKRIGELRNAVLELEALIAYDIDFPEEDDGPIDSSIIVEKATALMQSLNALLETAQRGEMIREGAVVVIAGPPNAGKSSLFNALIGRARAIVTEIPGTTRDAIEAVLDGQKWPIRLVDTAGLRDTTDLVEKIGIETSERYLKSAHIVLACGDSEEAVSATVAACKALTDSPIVPVRTKSDLAPAVSNPVSNPVSIPMTISDLTPQFVSAETGQGLRQLLSAVEEIITFHYGGNAPADVPLLTRTRHETAVRSALSEVEAFETVWKDDNFPAPIAAVHLRTASVFLEELIGTVGVEDVLDRVFSSFCVGK